MPTLLRTPVHSYTDPAAWQAFVSEHFVPLEVLPALRQDFRNQAASDYLGLLQVSELSCDSAQRVMRTPTLARRAEQRLIKLSVQLSGSSEIKQGKRSTTLQVGQWGLYDTSLPYEVAMSQRSHFLVLQCPEEKLSPWLRCLSKVTALSFDASKGPARVALGMLRLGLNEHASLPSHVCTELSDTIIRMLGLSLTAQLEVEGKAWSSETNLEEVRHAQLLQIQQYIHENLGNSELNVQFLAQYFRMSRRYLYKLFERLDQAPADYIQALRLEQACRMLMDNAASTPINTLAWSLGFSDAAVFSHAFRRRHGISPTEWRRRQLGVEGSCG